MSLLNLGNINFQLILSRCLCLLLYFQQHIYLRLINVSAHVSSSLVASAALKSPSQRAQVI